MGRVHHVRFEEKREARSVVRTRVVAAAAAAAGTGGGKGSSRATGVSAHDDWGRRGQADGGCCPRRTSRTSCREYERRKNHGAPTAHLKSHSQLATSGEGGGAPSFFDRWCASRWSTMVVHDTVERSGARRLLAITHLHSPKHQHAFSAKGPPAVVRFRQCGPVTVSSRGATTRAELSAWRSRSVRDVTQDEGTTIRSIFGPPVAHARVCVAAGG